MWRFFVLVEYGGRILPPWKLFCTMRVGRRSASWGGLAVCIRRVGRRSALWGGANQPFGRFGQVCSSGPI
ncbi:MAG: hypothetical protein KH828_13145 [Clostridiales bacterium]|nr:hypothetical protein [Clostridiales bacterium]